MSYMDYYEGREREMRESQYFEPPHCGICGGAHDEKRCEDRDDGMGDCDDEEYIPPKLPESLDPSYRYGGGDPLSDYLHQKGEL